MITDDEIMRLFELADPARDDDGARTADAAGYLDALQQRSYDMQLIDTTEAPTQSPRDNRWVLAAIAAAAIVLIVAGALILTRDDDEPVPVAPPTTVAPTTVAPVAPTTVVPAELTTSAEQTAGQPVDGAIALVRAYYTAANAYDPELAWHSLADGVIIDGETWDLEKYRLGTEFARAIRETSLLGDCAPVAGQEPGITIRCDVTYLGMRSGELGLGPFPVAIEVVVDGGKITSIGPTGEDFSDNGFQEQVWDPFRAWIDAQHPDDAAVMYATTGTEKSSATPESIQLWEQRTREYAELRLTAERVAAEFLQAFAGFDAEATGAHLATGASTEHLINQDVADYRQAIALYQAMGYEQELGTCQQLGATATELHVRCPFAYHLLGSRELGLGPWDENYFTVTVDDASGLITKVNSSWHDADFGRDIGDAFATWVETTHPDEFQTMTADGSPALTPESLALWEQLRHEYVQHVLDTPPTTTAP